MLFHPTPFSHPAFPFSHTSCSLDSYEGPAYGKLKIDLECGYFMVDSLEAAHWKKILNHKRNALFFF